MSAGCIGSVSRGGSCCPISLVGVGGGKRSFLFKFSNKSSLYIICLFVLIFRVSFNDSSSVAPDLPSHLLKTKGKGT